MLIQGIAAQIWDDFTSGKKNINQLTEKEQKKEILLLFHLNPCQIQRLVKSQPDLILFLAGRPKVNP